MERTPQAPPPSDSGAPRPAPGGFTLLEVLIAVAIFSICASGLLSSFQISCKAFKNGRDAAAAMQTLRFTVEQISRDLRAVYYETDYNQRFAALQYHMRANESMEILRLQEEQDKYRDGETEPGFVGLKLDLVFLGKGGGKGAKGDGAASIDFAHFTPSDGTVHDSPRWGAERVHYYLAGPDGTDLYRQRSSVKVVVKVNPNLEEEVLLAMKNRDWTGPEIGRKNNKTKTRRTGKETPPDADQVMNRVRTMALRQGGLPPEYQMPLDVNYLIEEKPEAHPPELIAENVTNFTLSFGRYNGQWEESKTWDSNEKAYRTPPFNVHPGDPQFLAKLMAYQRRPTDYLPAYVKLSLGIQVSGDRKRKASKKKLKTHRLDMVIWIPSALEIYTPEDDILFESFPPDEGWQ